MKNKTVRPRRVRVARDGRQHEIAMHATGQVGVSARYKFRRVAADGTVREETGWSNNLIVQQGLDFFLNSGGPSAAATFCRVGSGTTTPALGQTALVATVASSTTVEEGVTTFQSATDPKYVKYRYRYRFPLGAAAGNLNEVGIFTTYSPIIMISRALIKDASGNPTTLVVLSDEFLDVIWELFLLPPTASGTFNMFIDGVSTAFNYSIAPLRFGTSSYWGAFDHSSAVSISGYVPKFIPQVNTNVEYSAGRHSGTGLAAVTANTCTGTIPSPNGNFATYSEAAYVAGSNQRTFEYQMPLNNGNNAAGLNTFMFSFSSGYFQMTLNNPIMKVNTKTLKLSFLVSIANTSIPTN